MGVCACPPHTIANVDESCVAEKLKPNLLTRIYHPPILSKNRSESDMEFPGNKCGTNKLCKMGSVCKPIHSTEPHCVCDTRMIVNATGYCTTKLLSNFKKSKN